MLNFKFVLFFAWNTYFNSSSKKTQRNKSRGCLSLFLTKKSKFDGPRKCKTGVEQITSNLSGEFYRVKWLFLTTFLARNRNVPKLSSIIIEK